MSEALVQNAADAEQVKKAAKKEKRGRERELNDICLVMSSKEGRRFVWRFLEHCGPYKTSFGQGNDQTNFNEGVRSVGLKLIADINDARPEGYLQMLKESKEE